MTACSEPQTLDVATLTVDEILAELRTHLPYSLHLEVYTDCDEGWDIYVHGDLPGRRDDRCIDLHQFGPNSSFRDVLAALLLVAREASAKWDPIDGATS